MRTDFEKALTLLQSRPEIAADVLIMAGARPTPEYVKNARSDVERIMRKQMLGLEQEIFMIFAIDINGQLIDSEVLFKGFEGMVLTSPKIILRWLMTRNGSVKSYFVAHNHPTGASRPSDPDIDMTEGLIRLSILAEIDMVDHLIIGAGGNITSVRDTVVDNIRRYGKPKGDLLGKLLDADDIIKKIYESIGVAQHAINVEADKLWSVE